MKNIEINIEALLEKMSIRISEDAKKIAMLEATVDVYAKLNEELEKQLNLLRDLQNQ